MKESTITIGNFLVAGTPAEGLTLMTRRAFPTREAADAYAATMHPSLHAVVIECPRALAIFRPEEVRS